MKLKGTLQDTEIELSALKREQANNLGAQVSHNDQQINAMALST